MPRHLMEFTDIHIESGNNFEPAQEVVDALVLPSELFHDRWRQLVLLVEDVSQATLLLVVELYLVEEVVSHL